MSTSKQITAKQLGSRLAAGERITLVDVRSSLEFRSGHIPGSKNISLNELSDSVPGLEEGSALVLVCRSGARSAQAQAKLLGRHPNALNLTGGVLAWQADGGQLEKPAPSPRFLERQVHLVAGIILIAALWLGHSVNPAFIWLAALPAFGLMLDAAIGFCPMSWILSQAPWNRPAA